MKNPIPDSALLQHIALLGKTGSGKTTTAKGIIEHLADRGDRICILDPIKSDWWGLTSSADGKRAGLPFCILGGPHGNLPLNPLSGAALAALVSDGSLPLSIFDMADFGPGQQSKFFIDFAPVLLRKMRGVVYLVIEEAHIFAPKERSGVGDENMAVHYAKMLATAGRSKGIRLVLLTQRTQALHNALIGSCDTMIAHRLTAPADQKPVIEWLKANAEKDVVSKVTSSMANQKTGTGWLCSGEARVFEHIAFPRIRTYDNSATPTGDSDIHEVKTAAIDIEKLKSIMGEAVKEAELNNVPALRARIRELEAKLKMEQGTVAGTSEALAGAKRQGYEEGMTYFKPTVDMMRKALKKIAEDALMAERGEEIVLGAGCTMRGYGVKPIDKIDVQKLVDDFPKVSREVAKRGLDALDKAVSFIQEMNVKPAHRQILTVLAQAHPRGRTMNKIAVFCAKAVSGGFRNYVYYLSNAGLISKNGDTYEITGHGLAALGNFEPLPMAGEPLLNWWKTKLRPAENDILDAIIAAQPRSLSMVEIAQAVRKEVSGGFRNYVYHLSSLELIEKVGGSYRASGELAW